MKKYFKPNRALLFFSFLVFSQHCHAKTLMTTEQLKAETGKGFAVSLNPTGSINIAMDGHTKSGIPVSAYGTVDVLQKAQENHLNSLALSDAAQQGMHAFSSVNAVESSIQVLTNLVVNINSTTHTINQVNHALQQGLQQRLSQ